MSKTTKKSKVKAVKAKLPARVPLKSGKGDYTFPPRIFGDDNLRDDLRAFLLNWFKTNEYRTALNYWHAGADKDVRMWDVVLYALAPFFIELATPRVGGSPIRAAELLAKRFMCTAGDIHFQLDEHGKAYAVECFWDEWFRTDDIELWRTKYRSYAHAAV